MWWKDDLSYGGNDGYDQMQKSEQEHLGKIGAAALAKRWPHMIAGFSAAALAVFLMVYGGVRLIIG